MDVPAESHVDNPGKPTSVEDPSEVKISESPLSQSTYLAIWAISLVASFGIFFVYF
ncbi:MAG: hypothetical protein QGH38_00910 [Candidatus Thalassarchaeaceae archaeon]|jgi:hypothetical protein|nr:hypothetical protein [Candidatus Thalassarchaeaceae archaeon]